MMKKTKTVAGLVALVAGLSFASCASQSEPIESVSEDLIFCESVLAYKDGALIANFGTVERDPLNNEGMGFIKYFVDGQMQDFVVTDGNLSAPKGMIVSGDKLYIADVNKVVIYNTSDLAAAPTVIQLPEQEIFANHFEQIGNKLLVSITNTGNILSFELDNDSMPIDSTPEIYANVVGANGLLYTGSTLYIASYPADGVMTDANLIYKIEDVENPIVEPVSDRAGRYDGLAMIGSDLYFTDWNGGAVGRLNLESGSVEILNADMPLDGPAEIDVVNGKIAVPDMVNSTVYFFEVE